MQNEYPEHIDHIDDFYQGNLGEIKIDPPAELWERISTAMEKDKKPKPFPFFPFKFSANVFILMIISVAIATAGILIYKNNNQTTGPLKDKSSPIINSDTLGHSSDTSFSKELNNTEPKIVNSTNSPTKPGIQSKNKPEVSTETTPQNTNTESPSVINEKTISKDSIKPSPAHQPEVKEEIKAEKKKLGFKEKYKKQLQDSTRDLFVPQK